MFVFGLVNCLFANGNSINWNLSRFKKVLQKFKLPVFFSQNYLKKQVFVRGGGMVISTITGELLLWIWSSRLTLIGGGTSKIASKC